MKKYEEKLQIGIVWDNFSHNTLKRHKSKMSLLLQRTNLTGSRWAFYSGCHYYVLFCDFTPLFRCLALFWPADFSSLLHRSDGSFDRSLAPPAPLLCFSLSASVSRQMLSTREQSSEGFRPSNTHTHTHAVMYRPGLGPVPLLVHSLPRTALVALASKSFPVATISAVL